MKTKLMAILAVAATAAITVAALATAQPASADYSNCRNNHVCLWSGANATGDKLFERDGSFMNRNRKEPGYDSYRLRRFPRAYSSNNRTLGRFCTYNANNELTNILNSQTFGNLANNDTRWVKIC